MAKIKLSKEEKKALKASKPTFFQEFKKFIMRGNVVDMATGVIVAGAFTKIVQSLTNSVFLPIVNAIVYQVTNGKDLLLITILNKTSYLVEVDGKMVVNPECIYINWGLVIEAVVNFLLVALIIFTVVKVINSVRAKLDYIKNYKSKEELAALEAEKEAAIAAAQKAEVEAQVAKQQADAAKAANESTNQLLVEIINLLKK